MAKILLKGKFICFEKEFYGLFILALDRQSENEDLVVAAGRSSFISTYSVDSDAGELMNIIRELIKDEEASIDMSREVRALMRSQMDNIKETFQSSLSDVEEVLKRLFDDYLRSDVDVTLSIEKNEHFSTVDIEKEKAEEEKKSEEEERRNHYKIPGNAQVVDCFIVLSPIKGKPIRQIEEGDLVLCKLDDSTALGKDIASTYDLYGKDNRLKPSIGKVHKKFVEGNEVVIILQLTRNLMGMAREDEAVKVSYVEPQRIVSRREISHKKERREEFESQQKEFKKEQVKNEMFIYLSIGVFIIIIALILLLFF